MNQTWVNDGEVSNENFSNKFLLIWTIVFLQCSTQTQNIKPSSNSYLPLEYTFYFNKKNAFHYFTNCKLKIFSTFIKDIFQLLALTCISEFLWLRANKCLGWDSDSLACQTGVIFAYLCLFCRLLTAQQWYSKRFAS